MSFLASQENRMRVTILIVESTWILHNIINHIVITIMKWLRILYAKRQEDVFKSNFTI